MRHTGSQPRSGPSLHHLLIPVLFAPLSGVSYCDANWHELRLAFKALLKSVPTTTKNLVSDYSVTHFQAHLSAEMLQAPPHPCLSPVSGHGTLLL